MIAVECQEYRTARVHALDDAGVAGDFNQITALEWIAHAEQHACQKVLRDVTKCKANDDAGEARSTQNRECKARKACGLKDEVNPEQ